MWIIFFLITFALQSILSYKDLKYRKLENRNLVFLSYVPAIIGGLLLKGLSLDFFFGFLQLFIVFYLIELISEIVTNDPNHTAIGGIDIIASPIYTVWFGKATLLFLIVLLVVYLIFSSKLVMTFISKVYVERETNPRTLTQVPLLPVLQITCGLLMILRFFIFTH